MPIFIISSYVLIVGSFVCFGSSSSPDQVLTNVLLYFVACVSFLQLHVSQMLQPCFFLSTDWGALSKHIQCQTQVPGFLQCYFCFTLCQASFLPGMSLLHCFTFVLSAKFSLVQRSVLKFFILFHRRYTIIIAEAIWQVSQAYCSVFWHFIIETLKFTQQHPRTKSSVFDRMEWILQDHSKRNETKIGKQQ